jgi:D-glycerate 3-kinase
MRADASTHGYATDVVERVLDALLARAARLRRPLLAGISGLQGSGKSTLARELGVSARARGVRCEVLSLDDVYYGRRERLRLARTRHPLFATRGVPGTHDVALLQRTLAALAMASPRRPARVPRFDKGHDTRVTPSRWRTVTRPPELIVLEGWCVGVPPQDAGALRRPVNALERDEDRDGRWRVAVNAALAGDYARLWRRLDRLVLLQAPSFAVVARWRDEQEQSLRARGAPRALDRAALRRFLTHYERLSRHALRTLPVRADIRLVLDAHRRVRAIEGA